MRAGVSPSGSTVGGGKRRAAEEARVGEWMVMQGGVGRSGVRALVNPSGSTVEGV